MGRDSGFIAVGATLASQEVNFTLIPEQKFALHGERGFLAALEKRLLHRKHAVIAVAEGAGQHLFPAATAERDASGNVKFQDIGPFLKQEILSHFAKRSIPGGREVHRSELLSSAACPPTAPTACSAIRSPGARFTPAWPARPTCSWPCCITPSFTCPFRWRPPSGGKSIWKAKAGRRSSRQPANRGDFE